MEDMEDMEDLGLITVKEMMWRLRTALSPLYGRGEANAMTDLIFYHLKGWNRTQIIINEDKLLSPFIRSRIAEIIDRLLKNEPIQYILGTARFYGMNLTVNRSVLIPRPETGELVDMIIDRFRRQEDLRVLDIGTGSGAIAIALSRNLLFPHISACDISEEALSVARENARVLHADIRFLHEDVFKMELEASSFDIIVSNPPYVDESEKAAMEPNVLEYEPASALFVPDDNPLIYYSRILEIAKTGLAPGGMLYFEINPRHADALRSLAINDGFSNVTLSDDSFGKQRFLSALKIN